MKSILALALFATSAVAGWYQRGDQWLQSDSPAPWTAKGFVARSDAEKSAWDCAQAGGTISNSVCVIPPPVIPPPEVDFVAATTQVHSNRVLLTDITGEHVVSISVVISNGVLTLVPTQESFSPFDPIKGDTLSRSNVNALITKRVGGFAAEIGDVPAEDAITALARATNRRFNDLVDAIRAINKTATATNQTAGVRMTMQEWKTNIVTRLPQ